VFIPIISSAEERISIGSFLIKVLASSPSVEFSSSLSMCKRRIGVNVNCLMFKVGPGMEIKMLDDSDKIYVHLGWIHPNTPSLYWMINFLQLTQACCYHYFKVIFRVRKVS
jgi:hypothetical protein